MALPSWRQVPLFWQSANVGEFSLPPHLEHGKCVVTITAKLKEDEKKKDGKDKKKSTVLSIEPCDIQIDLEFNVLIWDIVEPIIKGLKPDGKPRDLIHPKAAVYNISAVLIKEASDLEIEGGVGRISWTGTEWAPPAATGQTLILRRGSRGKEVGRWQQFLTEQKFGEAEGFSPVDEIFGVLTENGTKGFQEREKIKVDGIVGPETFGAASKYGYAPPPPVTGGTGGVSTPDSAEDAQQKAVEAAQQAVEDALNEAAGIAGAAGEHLGGDENEGVGAGVAGGSVDDYDGE